MTGVLAAMEDATVALYAANAGRGGCTLREARGVRSAWAPSASPALNVVLGTRVPRDELPDVIRETIAHAAGRPFLWKVLPGDADRDALVAALLAAGLVELEPSTAIVGPIPDGLDALLAHLPAARPVCSAADFERWLMPFVAAFHLPPSDVEVLRAVASETDFSRGPAHVVVEVDGRPVACGTLVLAHPTLAAAFNVAVLPDARRAGFGSAVLGALAAAARERGRTHLGQFSTPAGLPLYRPWGEVLEPPVRNLVHA